MSISNFTLADMVRSGSRKFATRQWLLFEGNSFTYKDCLERMEKAARRLVAAGVNPGDRIAIIAQNRIEHLDLLFAAARIGAILAELNWRSSTEEMIFMIEDSSPCVIVAEPAYLDALDAFRARMVEKIWFSLDEGRPGSLLWMEADEVDLPAVTTSSNDVVLIIYTAAIAGWPRGASLSHCNLLSSSLQLGAAWSLSEFDVGLILLPLYHISGIGQVLSVQLAGGKNVMLRRFDPAEACISIAREKVTLFFEFAPMLQQILDSNSHKPQNLSSLQKVWVLDNVETVNRFSNSCPDVEVFSGYGQSETSGLVSIGRFDEKPGYAGRPLGITSISILYENGIEAQDGETGEITVTGSTIFQGYWNSPAENAHTFRFGRHHTGDLGYFDRHGNLIFAGRSASKELIKTGGENVYPAEVEEVILKHSLVKHVVVIGVPDQEWHEAVKAICVLKAGSILDADAIKQFVADRLARFKRPKHVEFVADLPRTQTGDIDRSEVKNRFG